METKAPAKQEAEQRVLFYEGRRIYFRPLEKDEEALARRWMNDPANWRTLRSARPLTRKAEIEALQRLQEDPNCFHFAIVRREDERLIGMIGLHEVDWVARNACLGIVIGPRECQGLGYGGEAIELLLRFAFCEQNLNRVWLTCFSHNERGIRTYKRAGFQLEGRLRQAAYREGGYRDELCFGLLRAEWESRWAEQTARPTRRARETRAADAGIDETELATVDAAQASDEADGADQPALATEDEGEFDMQPRAAARCGGPRGARKAVIGPPAG